MMNEFDYAGIYTERTMHDALCRGLRATGRLIGEIGEAMDETTSSESALAEDAIAALTQANNRIRRLRECIESDKRKERGDA